MKTTLRFEGPSDLSVGTIRIHGGGQSVADWVATPGNLTFQTEDIAPGLYATDIGPAGVAPQSVIFEVRAGVDNQVILPPFSALSASGSNTSYFDTRSLQTFDRMPAGLTLDLREPTMPGAGVIASPAREQTARPESMTPLERSGKTSHISIGLSEETHGPGSFDAFRSPASMELFAGRVELDIPDSPTRDPWAAQRVRLSIAIAQVRIEHCLLPLYSGGTRITVSTPPFAPSDVEFNITPVDPRARALLRALDAGTSEEAQAVRQHVVYEHLESEPSTGADPWIAILLGLLSVRFPQIFASIDRRWAASLAEHAGWAFDTHVILASHILAAARDQDMAVQHEAVAEVVSLFTREQVAGPPYYRYTNQLFAEMADGIAHYLEPADSPISAASIERFAQVRNRWYRELPLQRGAGAAFTWLARDHHALRARRVMLPNRHPSGELPRQRTLVLFEGALSAGKISLLRGRSPHPQPAPAGGGRVDQAMPSEGPVTRGGPARSPTYPTTSSSPTAGGSRRRSALPEDPNKGRFGGQSQRDGFTLAARFEPADGPKQVTVALTVVADDAACVGLEDYACFVLHPTFSPSEVKVSFRGGRAQLRIQAWGGFTVGVRIPRADVVLELDLAQADGAPPIIRTR